MRSALSGRIGPALVAGLAILPGAVGVSMAFFYFGNWPFHARVGQVFAGAVAGGLLWFFVSLICFRRLANVETADVAAYCELVDRVDSLTAQIEACKAPAAGDPAASICAEGISEASFLAGCFQKKLSGEGSAPGKSPLRWLGGAGYISLWRQLHRAEEALLQAKPKEQLYIDALEVESRLDKSAADGDDTFVDELRLVLGGPQQRRPKADVLPDLDKPDQRILIRRCRYLLNSHRDDLFERIVRVRNRMFQTLVFAGLVGDGVIALAMLVLSKDDQNLVAVGLTYYLVGALVGLFAGLYAASHGESGAVHDYGLAVVAVLTIPVLSGIAGVGGPVITRLGGTATTSDTASLAEIFSLHQYPFGLVIAAIFGLTPGLLLTRLRAETDSYKKELIKSGAGTPST